MVKSRADTVERPVLNPTGSLKVGSAVADG